MNLNEEYTAEQQRADHLARAHAPRGYEMDFGGGPEDTTPYLIEKASREQFEEED